MAHHQLSFAHKLKAVCDGPCANPFDNGRRRAVRAISTRSGQTADLGIRVAIRVDGGRLRGPARIGRVVDAYVRHMDCPPMHQGPRREVIHSDACVP